MRKINGRGAPARLINKPASSSNILARLKPAIKKLILTACLALTPFLTLNTAAYAVCANVGGIVTCLTDDTDGFASAAITDLTVNNGVVVDDQGTEIPGASAIIDITGDINGTLLNNGTITDTGTLNDSAISVRGQITNLTNTGLISGSDSGVFAGTNIISLTNTETGIINGDINGVRSLILITELVNNGAINSANGNGIKSDVDINILINNGTIFGGDDGVDADNDIISLTNTITGTITGFEDGVDAENNIGTLINSGTIEGLTENGVEADGNITNLTNSGTITGEDTGIFAFGNIGTLENTSDIFGINGDGVFSFTNIDRLINSETGQIIGGTDGVHAQNIIKFLENSGTIQGQLFGVIANNNIRILNNSGTIKGIFQAGIITFDDIDNLTNSGSITGGDVGVFAFNSIGTLSNSGTIEGTNFIGVNAELVIESLSNSGTIIGGDIAVSAGFGGNNDGISNLTNSGVLTGPIFSVLSDGKLDTHLTLNPGSDVFGLFDLGGGTNTLTVGKGLSIDHLFTLLPQIINPSGQPVFINGNRVVVVDTTDLPQQQDKILFDLTRGIFNTVFNNIGDGRNPGNSFVNGGPLPQFSLGAVSPEQNLTSNDTSHMWASIFGSHRNDDDSRHNLGGLIVGLDGKINSSLRLGAFFGTSRTDVNLEGLGRNMETDSIFGGLYASLNADGITIDLGVTGGKTDNEGSRIVDNNRVLGLQTVTSDFDGTFIAPEVSISTLTDIGGTTIKPTLRVGYAGLFLDGYSEGGGPNVAPLTFSDNDIHILHARLEIAALMHLEGGDSLNFQYSPYVGIEGRSLIDGEATNISLFGTSYNFNTDGDDDIGSAFAGLRLSILQTETFGIFAGIEGSVDTQSSTLLTANAGLKWHF